MSGIVLVFEQLPFQQGSIQCLLSKGIEEGQDDVQKNPLSLPGGCLGGKRSEISKIQYAKECEFCKGAADT